MMRQKAIRFLMQNKILVNPDLLEKIPEDEFDIALFYKKILNNKENLNDELLNQIINDVITHTKSIVSSQDVLDYDDKIEERLNKFNIKLVENYVKEPEQIEIKDFISHYNKRLDSTVQLLRKRQELEGIISISRLESYDEREPVAIVGMVSEKNETKNGHYMLTLEDRSGLIKVLISKNNKELHELCSDVMLDEVIGITGTNGKDIVFADQIIYADVPLNKPLKKSPNDNYSVFISDTHIGSKMFKEEEFLKFVDWINGNVGNEVQKSIARKVKYLFIVGDLVEGIGIFPSQEQDVKVKDIYLQYELAYKYLSKVRKDLCIVITPGNHDPMRIAEPQPMHYKDYAKKLYELSNVIFVSSPSYLSIDVSDTFEGLDVLLYHGFSIPYYADQVSSIRKAGGQKRTDLIMHYYLSRRHLAPVHSSTQFVPDASRDPLLIQKVPDIFATGHIHRYSMSNYRNVTCLNCSCWLSATDYQIKLGIIPQPCRAMLVHHKTRKVQVLKFGEDENESDEE